MVENGNRSLTHAFGGEWTGAKLHVLGRYLQAYNVALQDTRFSKGYIDAFAGTGYRTLRNKQSSDRDLLFPELAESEPGRRGRYRASPPTEPSVRV